MTESYRALLDFAMRSPHSAESFDSELVKVLPASMGTAPVHRLRMKLPLRAAGVECTTMRQSASNA